MKLFLVTADYRKHNPDKPTYKVAANTEKECRKNFKSCFPWLDIYDVKLLDEEPDRNALFYREYGA